MKLFCHAFVCAVVNSEARSSSPEAVGAFLHAHAALANEPKVLETSWSPAPAKAGFEEEAAAIGFEGEQHKPFLGKEGFVFDRCAKIKAIDSERNYEGDSSKITIEAPTEACDKFCKDDKNNVYFGLLAGSKCWCGSNYQISPSDNDKSHTCSVPCAGDPAQMCGGVESSSIYLSSNLGC